MTDYARPSFTELNARITDDLAIIPAELAIPLAAMWARACHSQHGYLDWILAQCSPLTCDLERLYEWASLYSVSRLLPVAASGTVLATGNIGTIILAGTLLRAANGFDYSVLAAVTLTSSLTPVTVRCTTTGDTTNIAQSQRLTLIDPIEGCNNQLKVGLQGITGGAVEESIDAWRLRVIEEWQTTVKFGGRSGKPNDYIAWAKAAHPAVTGALIQRHGLGVGTVLVRPICNQLNQRQPTQAILNAVANFLPAVAPAVADWRIAIPLLHYVDVSLTLSPTADTAENRQAIIDSLTVLSLSKNNEQDLLLLTELDAAILSVTSNYIRTTPLVNLTADAGAVFLFNVIFG